MDALTDDGHGHPDYLALEPRDRALVRAILMAALRHRTDLEAILDRFVDRPLPEGATALRHILHVALAQILFLDVPDHSAVDLAVDSANADPRSRRFASLVNALTRRAVRSKDRLTVHIVEHPKDGPSWFVSMLTETYGEACAASIKAAHRREAPLDLALRQTGPSADDYAGSVNGIALRDYAVRLAPGNSVTEMPGFDEGQFWVQDVAAGIPAKLMGNVASKHVLDACAAPGGKTAQLLDAGATVTALDISKNRLKRLHANMVRLGLEPNCRTVASSLFDYQPEQLFDAVLLDAPCSSTGTIRRHPDVAWVKSDDDIVKLADLQARMLTQCSQWVAPGGVVVFSNCSLDPREGETVAADFAEAHENDFAIEPVTAEDLPWLPNAITKDGHVRTTPAMLAMEDPMLSGLDGFFAARFRRKA